MNLHLVKQLKPVIEPIDLILICGATSGGTTLISSLLDQHYKNQCTVHESQLHFPADSPLKAKFVQRHKSFEEYAEHLFKSHNKVVSIEEFRKACYYVYKHKSGYHLYVKTVFDKSPNYNLVRAAKYYEAFPQMKSIVIYRSPGATIEGMMRKWSLFRDAGIRKLAEFWNEIFSTFISTEERLGFPSIYVNYEKFVGNSSQILSYLERSYNLDKRYRIKSYSNTQDQPGKALRNVQSGKILISQNVNYPWQNAFTQSQLDLIEDITGDTLNHLNKKLSVIKVE